MIPLGQTIRSACKTRGGGGDRQRSVLWLAARPRGIDLGQRITTRLERALHVVGVPRPSAVAPAERDSKLRSAGVPVAPIIAVSRPFADPEPGGLPRA